MHRLTSQLPFCFKRIDRRLLPETAFNSRSYQCHGTSPFPVPETSLSRRHVPRRHLSTVCSTSAIPLPYDGRPELIHDSARGSSNEHRSLVSTRTPFDLLVDDINRVLGPSSGLDSNDVDVEELKQLLAQYPSKEDDWSKYAFSDPGQAYTRNLVDHGNGKCNMLILVWTPGRSSPIHDHANAHCVMKILKGSLRETIYDWPRRQRTELSPAALHVQRATTYKPNEVTYMSDDLGLHAVQNPDPTDYAVSLHLYTPPNAAKYGCHMFNETTGEKTHVQSCHFHSRMGVRT